MGWSGESRAIRDALGKENRVTREPCAICGKNTATVHSKSAKYKMVTTLCYKCANEFLEQDAGATKSFPEETPADRLYKLLCFDNKPRTNYRSTEIP